MNNQPAVIPLTDEDVFPFGKYRDSQTKMKDVPADYLDHIHGVDWIHRWPALFEYLEKNRKAIDDELRRMGKI